MERTRLTRRIRELALKTGFHSIGIATAGNLPPQRLNRWLELEYHGEMAYLARRPQKRLQPQQIFEGLQSIVSVALNYNHPYPLPYPEPDRGVISRYAAGDDYHDVLLEKLGRLATGIGELVPQAHCRPYVDTGPLMEKEWAQRAGIGWIGKHTNLITKRRLGSWFFLGELLLDIPLEPDQPARDHCGSCTRCIEACPTEAIVAPYVLDSRRCISYLTIELRDDIPTEFRQPMGNLIFGCDICQDVCPWNSKAEPCSSPELAPRQENRSPLLSELARLDQSGFSRRFRGSPVKRTKRRGLLRNVAIALGNTGDPRHLPDLELLLDCDEPMVRRHAAWGLSQIGGRVARDLVSQRLKIEIDPATRQQLERILAGWD